MGRVSCPPVALSTLTTAAEIAGARTEGDAVVTGISADSRDVHPGDIFCCVRGESFDGHRFVDAAVKAGAVAVLADTDVEVPVPVVHVPEVRRVIGHLASAMLGRPATTMLMVGVTGTNGKTSTAAMIGSVLSAAGRSVEVLGTLTGVRTTPEAIELQSRLRSCADAGTDAVVMEVSSHALAQHRTAGVEFDVAVFTNFGRDHLDFHGTEDAYFEAKASLFTRGHARAGVVNADDARTAGLLTAPAIPTFGFSRADATDISVNAASVSYSLGPVRVTVPMGGEFTLMNSLAAARAARLLGCTDDDIVNGLAGMTPVPGRFEPVVGGAGFDVIVDYAHTPESLESLLLSVRAVSAGRVVLVFGCGGDRDRGKRPLMGATAARLADSVIVTSDNPRSEDPDAIIDEIMVGVGDGDTNVTREPDRARAIASAISRAQRGDIVVIAGKGHEATQEIAGVLHPFSDAEIARSSMAARKETHA